MQGNTTYGSYNGNATWLMGLPWVWLLLWLVPRGYVMFKQMEVLPCPTILFVLGLNHVAAGF